MYFGSIAHLSDYFASNGVKVPKEKNPAEFMIDVVSGDLDNDKDWSKVWVESDECSTMMSDIESLKKEYSTKEREEVAADKHEYASTTGTQLRLVTKRATIQVRSSYSLDSAVRLTNDSALARYRIRREQGHAAHW